MMMMMLFGMFIWFQMWNKLFLNEKTSCIHMDESLQCFHSYDQWLKIENDWNGVRHFIECHYLSIRFVLLLTQIRFICCLPKILCHLFKSIALHLHTKVHTHKPKKERERDKKQSECLRKIQTQYLAIN